MTRTQHRSDLHLDTPHRGASREWLRRQHVDGGPGDMAGAPPVPIVVWDVADTAHRGRRHRTDMLTPQLAALLVGATTRPSDLIVAAAQLPTLAGAAGAGGRGYRAEPDLHRLARLEHLDGAAALVVLPPPAGGPVPTGPDQLLAMFDACRRLIRPRGGVVMAMPTAGAPAARIREVIAAAHATGLSLQQHIVAVTAAVTGRRRPWTAAPAAATARRAAAPIRVHLELLTFSASRSAD